MNSINLFSLAIFLIFVSYISILPAREYDLNNDTLAIIRNNQSKSLHRISLSYYKGSVWVMSEATGNMASYMDSYEVTYGALTRGKKEWHNYYGNPAWGVSLVWHRYREVAIWGSSIGIIPHMEFNIAKNRRNLLSFRVGTGIGIFSKPFNHVNNHGNKAIGSSITAAMQLGVIYHYKITPSIEAQTGIVLTHYSNGNIKEPNWGINSFHWMLGIAYIMDSKKNDFLNEDSFKRKKLINKPKYQNRLEFYAASGTKEGDYRTTNSRTLFFSGSTMYGIKLGYRTKFGLGFDYMYDPSNFKNKNRTQWGLSDSTNYNFIDKWDLGLKFGHELIVGKLDFITYMGLYLHTKAILHKPIYSRIGLKYNFHPKWYFGIFLKTHLSVADYIEFAIGYNLDFKKKPK